MIRTRGYGYFLKTKTHVRHENEKNCMVYICDFVCPYT